MIEHLGEVAFQTLACALTAEALVRLWGTDDPGVRQRIRIIVVAVPVIAWPLMELIMPFRHGAAFEDGVALVVGRRWSTVRIAGVRADGLWLLLCAVASLPALLLDIVPAVRRLASPRRPDGPPVAPPARLSLVCDELAARMGVSARLACLDIAQPVLFCSGILRPTLVVSRGALQRLDDAELRAAIAHELSHVAHHDILLGWGLLAARLVQLWNPTVHIVGRAIARDAERRADDLAAATTGDGIALASAIVKLYQAPTGGSTLVVRATETSLAERCRRLLDVETREPTIWPRTRVAAAGVTALALGFLIT